MQLQRHKHSHGSCATHRAAHSRPSCHAMLLQALVRAAAKRFPDAKNSPSVSFLKVSPVPVQGPPGRLIKLNGEKRNKWGRNSARAWRLRRQRHIGSSCDSLSSCSLYITRVCSLAACQRAVLRPPLTTRPASRAGASATFPQHASLSPFCCKPCASARSQRCCGLRPAHVRAYLESVPRQPTPGLNAIPVQFNEPSRSPCKAQAAKWHYSTSKSRHVCEPQNLRPGRQAGTLKPDAGSLLLVVVLASCATVLLTQPGSHCPP